jgi:ribosome-binding protein aMBF1 (putative translation factor)
MMQGHPTHVHWVQHEQEVGRDADMPVGMEKIADSRARRRQRKNRNSAKSSTEESHHWGHQWNNDELQLSSVEASPLL